MKKDNCKKQKKLYDKCKKDWQKENERLADQWYRYIINNTSY